VPAWRPEAGRREAALLLQEGGDGERREGNKACDDPVLFCFDGFLAIAPICFLKSGFVRSPPKSKREKQNEDGPLIA
jgi:hypothetical protein